MYFANKTTTNRKWGCILGSDVIYCSKDEFLLPVNLLKSCAEQLAKRRNQVT
jgi:hypothetical protein